MAAVPSVSVRERTRAAWESESKPWRAAFVAALGLCVLYIVTPNATLRNLVIYPIGEGGAVAAILYGVHRYRPAAPAAWLFIAAGFGSWWIGDVLWGIYVAVGRSPFPSAADIFYLAGYPLMVAGLVIAVRRRRELVDLRASIDAGLVTVSAFLLTWIYLVWPVLDDSSVSVLERVVGAAYPVGDLLLLGIATRFVLGSSWNVRSLRLLVYGFGATLAGDLLFNLQIGGRVKNVALDDVTLLIGVLCVGLAGLHRTMTSLTEERGQPSDLDHTARFALLVAFGLLPPSVLIVQSLRGAPLYLAVTLTCMVATSLLIVVRFKVLTDRALRAADRERLLSVYARELMRAGDQDELYAIAERTASELVGEGRVAIVAPGEPDATHAFNAPVEVRGEQVAELVADASPLRIRRARDSLGTIAAELALSLEREQLLVAERETAAALAAQNERLLELDRMKDQFVSTVSHELRTPLTSMVGYLEILLEQEAGDLNEDQLHFLEIVDRNSRRLNELIEDVLVTSRIDTGRLSLEPTTVDIGQLVAERLESINGAAEQKGVELRVALAERVPQLWADPMRLGQVVDNLLSNAIKFTPAGGTVDVTVRTEGDACRIEVSDTGVGIPPDEVDRLFERFFRASTASTIQGNGLGLSIAKGIAEAHGGAISVASEVGVGTTFVVELPLQSPLAEAAAAAAGAET